jgi:hypothetical protein
MSRGILATALVLLLAAPAAATITYTNDTNPDISIYLTIDCFTNIYWNNGDVDHTIYFNSLVQDGTNTGDWWSVGPVRSAYGNATKASQDAFATGFFESYDTAYFWLQSNCNVDMTVTDAGDLSNGSSTLPTWYTIALTNNNYAIPTGFLDNGVGQSCGSIPLGGGPGTYAQDSFGDNSMTLFACTDDHGASAFYPNQWPFPMGAGLAPKGLFTGFAEGTVLFHARVERNGLADAAGTYTSSLNLAFSNP